jgi:hypothetical protein
MRSQAGADVATGAQWKQQQLMSEPEIKLAGWVVFSMWDQDLMNIS